MSATGPRDAWDPLHDWSAPSLHWTTTNVRENLTTLGDRLPGTSGQEVARSLLGRVPDDIVYAPTSRRYPVRAFG